VKGEWRTGGARCPALGLATGEPGWDNVVPEGAVVNSVNWSEVAEGRAEGVTMTGYVVKSLRRQLRLRGFSLEEGQKAAELHSLTKAHGLLGVIVSLPPSRSPAQP